MIHEIRTYNLKLGQLKRILGTLRRKITGTPRVIETRWTLVHRSGTAESDGRYLAL